MSESAVSAKRGWGSFGAKPAQSETPVRAAAKRRPPGRGRGGKRRVAFRLELVEGFTMDGFEVEKQSERIEHHCGILLTTGQRRRKVLRFSELAGLKSANFSA